MKPMYVIYATCTHIPILILYNGFSMSYEAGCVVFLFVVFYGISEISGFGSLWISDADS